IAGGRQYGPLSSITGVHTMPRAVSDREWSAVLANFRRSSFTQLSSAAYITFPSTGSVIDSTIPGKARPLALFPRQHLFVRAHPTRPVFAALHFPPLLADQGHFL